MRCRRLDGLVCTRLPHADSREWIGLGGSADKSSVRLSGMIQHRKPTAPCRGVRGARPVGLDRENTFPAVHRMARGPGRTPYVWSGQTSHGYVPHRPGRSALAATGRRPGRLGPGRAHTGRERSREDRRHQSVEQGCGRRLAEPPRHVPMSAGGQIRCLPHADCCFFFFFIDDQMHGILFSAGVWMGSCVHAFRTPTAGVD